MRSILSWLLGIPLALVVVSFAVSNLEPMVLRLWPLPFELEVPVYLGMLGALLAGFLIGAFVAWVSAGRHRKALKAERRRAEGLDREINQMKGRTVEADRRMAAGQPPLPDVPA